MPTISLFSDCLILREIHPEHQTTNKELLNEIKLWWSIGHLLQAGIEIPPPPPSRTSFGYGTTLFQL